MAESGELQHKRISRRNFLKKAGTLAVGGAAIGATAGGLSLGISELLKHLEGVGSGISGKFLLRREDGSFIISDTPQVVRVTYTPNADPTTKYWNENNIVVRRKPQADFGGSNDVPPEEIQAPYAVRVAGGSYGGPSEVARFKITHEGKEYIIGEWFTPSDEHGKPVNLKGEPLKEVEKPYFVAANFVTVEPAQTPTQ